MTPREYHRTCERCPQTFNTFSPKRVCCPRCEVQQTRERRAVRQLRDKTTEQKINFLRSRTPKELRKMILESNFSAYELSKPFVRRSVSADTKL